MKKVFFVLVAVATLSFASSCKKCGKCQDAKYGPTTTEDYCGNSAYIKSQQHSCEAIDGKWVNN